MRPSRRLLLIACLIVVASIALLAVPGVAIELVLAIWAALGLAMVVDILLTPGARMFHLAPTGHHEVFAGEDMTLDLHLVQTGGAQPRAGTVRIRIAWPEGLAAATETVLTPEPGGHGAALAVTAIRRGRWRIDEVGVLRPGRLGLVERTTVYPCDAVIAVVANIRSIASGDIDLQIASQMFGSKSASLRGEGSDFHQLRDFVGGMDRRTIDYKRSARHGTLIAREMRAERNHNIILAIDNGHLMREEIDGLPKLDHMLKAALALCWAGLQGGDLVGLYAFDARPHLFVPPSAGRQAFARIRSKTADLAYRSVETNHTLAISHLHQRLARRSLVVICSDFVDTTTAELLVENAAVLIRHHVVIFVSLRDPLLRNYSRRAVHGPAGVAQAVSVEGLVRERRLVLEKLGRLGVFVIDADPGAVTGRLVSTYLTIKSRELI